MGRRPFVNKSSSTKYDLLYSSQQVMLVLVIRLSIFAVSPFSELQFDECPALVLNQVLVQRQTAKSFGSCAGDNSQTLCCR